MMYKSTGKGMISEQGLTKDCPKEKPQYGSQVKDPEYSKMYDEYGHERYPMHNPCGKKK